MGRVQMSEEHHRLRGTKARPNQRGEHDREPSTVTGGRPRMPKSLSPSAAQAWKDAVRLLRKRRTLSAGDAPVLTVYANVFAKMQKANADIEARGFEVEVIRTNKKGEEYTTTVPNVSVRIATDCERQLLQLAKALGLTPDTREKVKPTKEEKKPTKWTPTANTLGAFMPELFDEKGRAKTC
jgi:P27 family predicted phage terminase small subunit